MTAAAQFDSRAEAVKHKVLVAKYMHMVCDELVRRAAVHDDSKFLKEEYELRDQHIPALRSVEYGSAEYNAILEKMKPAVDHHHRYNSHHPEHYANGINGMDLLDIVEMFCDWCAVMDLSDKSIATSKGAERFRFDAQLKDIFANTEAMAEAVRTAPEPQVEPESEGVRA